MSRAIDGDALMELFKEQYVHHKAMGHKPQAQGWQGAIQLLYDAPTLTPQNEVPPCYQPDSNDGCAYQCHDGDDEPIDKCKECPLCYSDKQRHLTPQNEWVSVDNKLPPNGVPVLIGNPHWDYPVVTSYAGSGVWMDSWHQKMTFTPTNWMPLPAPPGEDNNAQSKAPNEPLTQEDLDKMDYDKVWIDYEDDCGEWALVRNGYIYAIDTLEGAGLDIGDYMRGEKLEPHGYKVYRRPQERQETT